MGVKVWFTARKERTHVAGPQTERLHIARSPRPVVYVVVKPPCTSNAAAPIGYLEDGLVFVRLARVRCAEQAVGTSREEAVRTTGVEM